MTPRHYAGGVPCSSSVTVTGHSLGGTLTEITAHHFDLRGETFDSFGAASLSRLEAHHAYSFDLSAAAVSFDPADRDAAEDDGFDGRRWASNERIIVSFWPRSQATIPPLPSLHAA